MPILVTIVLALFCIIILALFLPVPGKNRYRISYPEKQFHEADAVLSRRKLVPETDRYTEYYKTHPEFKAQDDASRDAPGLLSRSSKYFEPASFLASEANFTLIETVGAATPGVPSAIKTRTDPANLTRFIMTWLKNSGAHSVGITGLKAHHLYSHKGWGS